MNFDDAPVKKDTPLTAVETEDLSTISIDELQDRVTRLAQEITRTKAEINAKGSSRTTAEAFFN